MADKFTVSSQLLNLGAEALKMAQATIGRSGTENWSPAERQAASELLTAITRLTTAAIDGMQIAVAPGATSPQAGATIPVAAEPTANGHTPAGKPK